LGNFVITHTDVDGIVSAAIALRAVGEAEVKFSGPRSIARTLSRVPGSGDVLVICDVAVNRDSLDRIVRELERLREGWRIVWIDHHPWPEEAAERISEMVDLTLRPAPSAARLVLEVLGGDETAERLAEIADDADTATYSMEESRLLRAVSRSGRLRLRAVRELAEDGWISQELESEARKRLAKMEEFVRRALERVVVVESGSGLRLGIIDLRPRGGPGSAVAQELGRMGRADVCLVIYSCDRFSLYSCSDAPVNLRPICESHGGGGHPFACGGRLEIGLLGRVLCRLLGRWYTPREIRALIDEILSCLGGPAPPS